MDIAQINVLKEIVEKDENILALYDYGSSVYGTMNPRSDRDAIMIVSNKENYTPNEQLSNYLDINIFTKEEFVQMINTHEITALECLFLSKDNVWKNNQEWTFNLNLQSLRNAISSKSSNSWVKAKKKFIVEKDFNEYIGKKSAWHAIRILDFGQQIGQNGYIVDFTRVNHFLPQIMNCSSWEEIDTNFRKTYNEASSQFKLVAPKEIEIKTNKP